VRDRPSFTAAFVAACRTFGSKLPRQARLADDPYGASFAGPGVAFLARHLPRVASLPLWPFALYMQVRTRVIDDALRDFVAAGGRQILLLGAGYDCRAARFAPELAAARAHVFEVDHPSTQARKREVLARAPMSGAVPTTYVPWNFETRPVAELPAALAAAGHDATLPTLTIWEGVTMYLTEPAIESSVAAVQRLSAPGSTFVVTYFERSRVDRPSAIRALVGRVVALSGEPFRFGWAPADLPVWFDARGFALESDRGMVDLARSLLPASYAQVIHERASRIAILRRC
jgi:methyltransferase (TIGR00027 family)